MTDSAKGSPAARIAVAAIGAALLLDAAVETSIAGSAVRWWVLGGALVYAAVTAALWRMRLGWQVQLFVAIFGVLGLVAATAWAPGGLTDGVRFFGQSTSRVMASLAAGGVVLAGLALVRTRTLPRAARVAAGLIAAYGAMAFLGGALDSTPLPVLLSGQSLWQRLPNVLQGAFLGAFVVLPIGLVWSIVKTGLRRPPETSMRAEVWKIAALATSFAIVLAGLPLRSGGASVSTSAGSASQPENLAALLGINPKTPKPSQEALDAALANSLRAIEDGERDIARDHWDPNYVATTLESDPERLFTWVRQNTFWIPYHGLLRGSAGVLMDRLGNSLDRAALLAILLRQSGRTVRLAHASLSPDQAVLLLPALYATRSATAPAVRPTADQLPAIAAQYQLDEASIRRTTAAQSDFGTRKRTQLMSHVLDQTKRLSAAVGSGPGDLSRTAFERAIEALQDHWWVQMLEGSDWQDFDLANASAGTALASATQTIEIDAFPDSLRHQVTVRVIAEQWSNGALREQVALQSILRPSQLIGTPVVLRFTPARVPMDLPANMPPEQGLRTLALDQHEWTPTLAIGTEATGQSVIRDTGDLVPARPDTGAAGAMGGAIGSAAGGLAKRLDDALGPPAAPPAETKPDGSKLLTATWLEYEIQQPGERPQKVRRALFDLLGPAARAAKQTPKVDEAGMVTRSLALMRETEILPIVCRYTPEYVLHLGAQSLLANRSMLAEVVRGNMPDDLGKVQEVAKALALVPTPLYGLALARFEWSRFGDEIYVDRPNILTRHTFFAPAQKSFNLVVATDIVTNDIGVDLSSDNPFAVRLEQGVLDTNAEAILVSDQPSASNAGWAFARSASWTTLRGPGDPQLGALGLADDVRRRIGDDLAAGFVVLAPKTPVVVGTEAFSGWWRVNPATGQALGIGSSGWGQDMVEYLLTIELSIFFYFFFCRLGGGSIASCRSKAIDFGIITALLLLLEFLTPAMALPRIPGGGKAPGIDPIDPFSKTEPGASRPAGASPPGPPAPGSPGPPGPGKPGLPPDYGGDYRKYPWSWGEPPSPELQKAIDQMTDATRNLSDYVQKIKAAKAQGAKSGGIGPDFLELQQQAAKAFQDWLKFKPDLPGTPGPIGGNVAPAGTPPASLAAPTQPGTGPGGTQIMPCSGPGCGSGAGAKTQAGIDGVLNTLGQKSGG